MNNPSPQKKKEWQERAALKGAIVPEYFEVFSDKVELQCGGCKHQYRRVLILGRNDPTFVCPNCRAKNWVPIRFDLK